MLLKICLIANKAYSDRGYQYDNVRSEADSYSQLNLPHETENRKTQGNRQQQTSPSANSLRLTLQACICCICPINTRINTNITKPFSLHVYPMFTIITIIH